MRFLRDLLKPLMTVLGTLAVASSATGAEKVEIKVLYSLAAVFEPVHKENARLFMEQNPNVQVRLLSPVKQYEEVAQGVLRGAITGDLPDVSYQGFNQQRVITDRKLAAPLDDFIKAEKDWANEGRIEGMLASGRFEGKQYGLPFAVSTPVMYLNADLVRKAGGDPDAMPQSWPEIIALARKIGELGGGVQGLQYNWMITGNWMWQALVLANGGNFMDEAERDVTIERPEAAFAMTQLAQIVRETGMPILSRDEVRAAFVAGRIGMLFSSTSELGAIARLVGDRFVLRTAGFPLTSKSGRLPGGGAAVMIHATSLEKQKAAWAYARFVTGAVGQTQQVRLTGYMPVNSIPQLRADMLGDFYKTNTNHLSSIRQLPVMTGWYAWPGDNSLKIVDVIHRSLEALVSSKTSNPAEANARMAAEIRKLLPGK